MVELAGIIILGIAAQWIAWRIKVPAILPLILIGLAVGPLSVFYTKNGEKLIEPIYNAELGHGLFPGSSLFYFVSLAIGVILFEGGLTLKRRELKDVGPVILKLITVGSIVTFVGAGLAAYYIMGLTLPIAFLFAGLIIVTGPTVIAPILQNVPLNRNVATVLKWEGILIDPIGALVAVLVFEFIQSSDGGMAFTSHALITFSQIILIGLALGATAGYFLYVMIKNDWIPHYLLNVFTLAFVLGAFVFSDVIAHESGLLTVVIMGTVLGNLEVPRLNEILSFKESLSVLLISLLFILLAANINMEDLYLVFNDWRPFALFGFIALILRPVGVFLSTRGSELNVREKIFISWVGPRGIVAAGIASLFGITLTNSGVPKAEYITPLVFFIVLGTVLLNATTARLVARVLGVIQSSSGGIMILGSSKASRVIGQYLQQNGRNVVLVDNNESSIRRTRELGMEGILANIYNEDLTEKFELLDVGYLFAMTSNADVNAYGIKKYSKEFGERGNYRLITSEELTLDIESRPQTGLFSYHDDFLNLNEVARDYPTIHELEVASIGELRTYYEQLNSNNKAIPLFIKDQEGSIHIIKRDLEVMDLPEGALYLVYLGQELEKAATIPEETPLQDVGKD
ncbi:MAG: sodium:proton antiporter [Saprospiraceae bacterium]